MEIKKSDILHLFDRPAESVSKEKNKIELPTNDSMDSAIVTRFANDTESNVPVKQISLHDLSELGREEPFSLFIPKHRKLAAKLIHIFLGMSYDDFLSKNWLNRLNYYRDLINPQMFIYALSVSILNRAETKNLLIPLLSEIFPDKYFDSEILARAREEVNGVSNGSRVRIEIPWNYTTSDHDKEQRLAYWREDIGLNLHHWHWHLVYSIDNITSFGRKDRRGELFYYMHNQIRARYNCERLCNQMGLVKSFNKWREPIPEAYFPKLNSLVSSRNWPGRPAGAVLKNITRSKYNWIIDLQDLEKWRDRIYGVIQTGVYINSDGERMSLTEFGGVDVLGNIVESNIFSPNSKIYGNLHVSVHMAIAYCQNPNEYDLESYGVIGDSATAMRDPIFYRLHAFLDDMFQEYKNTLPAYSLQQLDFPGVEITDIRVQTPNQPVNLISTFWAKSDVDLSRGLDLSGRRTVHARVTHLHHTDFKYIIVANNHNNASRKGTVRIFIAPKEDEHRLPYDFNDQRNLMIEMDKYPVLLRPGSNIIERKSTDSSLTVPFERTFRNLNENRPIGGDNLDAFNFCGCGWPQHMLVPKGKEEGFPMDLFIMISDYTDDAVEQDGPTGCKGAMSFCGLWNRKYPDARPIGYPMDRRPRDDVKTLAQFLTGNMAVTQINIRHTNAVLPRV